MYYGGGPTGQAPMGPQYQMMGHGGGGPGGPHMFPGPGGACGGGMMQQYQMSGGGMMAYGGGGAVQYGGGGGGGCYRAEMVSGPMPMGGGMVMGGQMMGGGPMECEVFVEVSPEVQPNFNRGPNGTFFMELGPIVVRLTTNCQPPPPSAPGLVPYKPYEEFVVQLPEVHRVVFDPNTQMPPNAMAMAQTRKRGAVLEVPQQVGVNAQLKANSPHGSLVLEDIQMSNGYKQKIGENTLHYRLQVDGQLAMNKNGGNHGAHRLEVELQFVFTCQLVLGAGPGPGEVGGAMAGAMMGGYGGGGMMPGGMPGMMMGGGGGGGMMGGGGGMMAPMGY